MTAKIEGERRAAIAETISLCDLVTHFGETEDTPKKTVDIDVLFAVLLTRLSALADGTVEPIDFSDDELAGWITFAHENKLLDDPVESEMVQ